MRIPSELDDAVDPGGAQRRLKLQLYSRMMTDLMVLTGGKRLPSDDEIHTELRRAARAYGVWTPRLEAAWREQVGGAQTDPQFVSHDPASGVADVGAPSIEIQGPAGNGAEEASNDEESGGIPLNIDRQALTDKILGNPSSLAGEPDDQIVAGDDDEWLAQDADTAGIARKETPGRVPGDAPPARDPSAPDIDPFRSGDRWPTHVTNGIAFEPDADKSYFAFLLGAEGISAADRLQELHRHILNGTSLADHLLQELHPSDERLAKVLEVIKTGVADSGALRTAFDTDIRRLQTIVDTEQARAGAAWAREARAFGTAYAIEAASNAAGFGVGKIIGKVAPIAIRTAAPSVRALGERAGGALSRFTGRVVENPAPRAVADFPDGSFSISDWSGYPAGVPRPRGPLRIVDGGDYETARVAANKANAMLRKQQGLVGQPVDVHEVQPVKFGGSPIDPTNKVILSRDIHRRQVTSWWNQLQKDLNK